MLKQYIRQDRLSYKSNIKLDIIRYKRATYNTIYNFYKSELF